MGATHCPNSSAGHWLSHLRGEGGAAFPAQAPKGYTKSLRQAPGQLSKNGAQASFGLEYGMVGCCFMSKRIDAPGTALDSCALCCFWDMD